MSIYDRTQRDKLDQLVADYTQHLLSRRKFLQRAVAIGLSASSAASLLAACGNPGNTGNTGGNSTPKSVDVLNVWGGEEQASFRAVVEPFTSRTGISVNIESTRDLDAVLTTRIRGNNPPDIAVLPNPAKMQQLASQNRLVPLDSFLDM